MYIKNNNDVLFKPPFSVFMGEITRFVEFLLVYLETSEWLTLTSDLLVWISVGPSLCPPLSCCWVWSPAAGSSPPDPSACLPGLYGPMTHTNTHITETMNPQIYCTYIYYQSHYSLFLCWLLTSVLWSWSHPLIHNIESLFLYSGASPRSLFDSV